MPKTKTKMPEKKYPAGQYVCVKECFDGSKRYLANTLRDVPEATDNASLKHFKLVKEGEPKSESKGKGGPDKIDPNKVLD